MISGAMLRVLRISPYAVAAMLCIAGCGRASLPDDPALGYGGGNPGAGGASASTAGAGPSGSGAGGAATTSTGSSGTGSSGSGSSGAGGASAGSSGAGGASGSGEGSTGTGQPTCPPLGDPCTTCMSEACPGTYCDCANEPDCFALIQCSSGCDGDQACQQACMTGHPSGIAQAILLGDCAATSCKAKCPGSNGDLPPCQKCIYEGCTDEANACLAEPACLALWKCLGGCGKLDLGCQQQCYADHGDGVTTLQALLQCTANTCQGECP